jgi:hypothetical protein
MRLAEGLCFSVCTFFCIQNANASLMVQSVVTVCRAIVFQAGAVDVKQGIVKSPDPFWLDQFKPQATE